MAMPSRFIVSLNAWRSSPRSMASTCTPITFTPYLLQHAGVVQLRGEVQARLAAQVRQQGIGPLLGDDLGHRLDRQRLDVGHVGHARDRS